MTYEYGQEAGRLISAKYPEITAVFATSDLVAMGVMRGLRDGGSEVPEQVSVIGFDDITIASMCTPPLTTIKQDTIARGITAADRLLSAIQNNGEQALTEPTIMPLKLIIRDSVRKLAD